MEIKKYMKALPVLAAMLLTAACSNEDNEIVEAPQPAQSRTVPFTVTVNSGSQTRATLGDNDYYKFETTDKLWVWTADEKVYGELSWDGATGEDYNRGTTYNGKFSGTLTVESGATLEASTTLYATIKSAGDEILGTFEQFQTRHFVPDYTLATSYASDDAEAVQKFSYFEATSTYGAKSFDFSGTQNTAFVRFDITLKDGTAAGPSINATIKNGGSKVCTGSVTTVSDGGKVHAKFIAGFPSGALSNPTVKLGAGYEFELGITKSLEANKMYNLRRDYTGYQIAASMTAPVVGPASKTITNITLPYEKTMSELLTMMSSEAATLASTVTACSSNSADPLGDNVTVSGSAPNFEFSATDTGTTVFSVTIGTAPYASTIDDLTVTVTQVPVVTP